MKFYESLYTAESCREDKKKICRKLKRNAGQLNVFVIVLSSGSNLLEFFHCALLQQKYYMTENLFIVGIAKGYQEAEELTQAILEDVYQETGDFKVKDYFLNKSI